MPRQHPLVVPVPIGTPQCCLWMAVKDTLFAAAVCKEKFTGTASCRRADHGKSCRHFRIGQQRLPLGLFAIFGIIRYRTESMPVREMTYLFVIIAISVINALSVQLSYAELTATNLLFILCIWLCESNRWLKHISCKLVQYDRIELITPQRRAELIMDLENRTGLSITKVEVGHIDFLRDAAILKVYYEPESEEINTIDTLRRIPREGE